MITESIAGASLPNGRIGGNQRQDLIWIVMIAQPLLAVKSSLWPLILGVVVIDSDLDPYQRGLIHVLFSRVVHSPAM